jgi:hypothetical protein
MPKTIRHSADPEAAISRAQKGMDFGISKGFSTRRHPWNKSNAIKPQHPGLGSHPNVAVRRLRDCYG